MSTNKSRIISTVKDSGEPLTRLEIATLAGFKNSNIGQELSELVRAGAIHARRETSTEREIRIGATRSRHANLYAVVRPVPRRTEPALCEGSMTNSTGLSGTGGRKSKVDNVEKFITAGFNSGERREKVALVKDAVTLSLRSVDQIAAKAGVSTTFVRDTLAALIADGAVEAVKREGRRGSRYRTTVSVPAETVKSVLQSKPAAVAKPEPKGSIIDAIKSYATEFEALKNANADLQAENEMLAARNTELETSLAAIRSAIA